MYKNKNLKNNKKNSGFTLIELMVAISIFMIIMLMAMGGVIVASDASKKADKLRNAIDNVNFAMESMTRSIRMGTNYSYSDGGNSFSFTSSDENVGAISYKLTESSSLQKCTSGGCVDMVSGEVKVDTLKFFVKGQELNDGIQPSVYIIMKGVVEIKGQQTSFALQTLASQRNLEQPE